MDILLWDDKYSNFYEKLVRMFCSVDKFDYSFVSFLVKYNSVCYKHCECVFKRPHEYIRKAHRCNWHEKFHCDFVNVL